MPMNLDGEANNPLRQRIVFACASIGSPSHCLTVSVVNYTVACVPKITVLCDDSTPPLPWAIAVSAPRDLARAAFAAQLPHRLDQQEQAVHAGVAIGQAAAVGVDRQAAAGRDAAALDEAPAFALRAEAEIFEEQDRVDRERVVELDDVDVRRAPARPSRRPARPDSSAPVTVRSGMREMLAWVIAWPQPST